MSNQENNDMNKPSPSRLTNVTKEPSAYTPPWMSPAERAKLKARIRKIRKKDEDWGTKKEEQTLVQKSPSRSPNREPAPPVEEMKPPPTTEELIDLPVDDQPSNISKEPSVTHHDSNTAKKSSSDSKKSSKSSKSPKSDKGSKESVSKKKSKEELTMAKKNKKSEHPKAAHANPSGNRVEDQSPWTPHPRDGLMAHLYATDFQNFDPQLYAFKTPEKLSTKRPVVAECPPFWVLNDHTIAVAWKLYCKDADRSDLGIVALQWSREFVSAMKDERGEYPNAIKHLLDAIEDGLIFRYSSAAEDSKKAHQKDDDISYASSDSVFKQPTEVSYTLKDIMSRNYPGRKFGDDSESAVVRKDDKTTAAVNKTFVIPEGEAVNQKDLINLLKQYKIEQEARIKQEMETSREIDRLIQQAKDGKLSTTTAQGGKKRHLDFDVPDESEPTVASSKKKHKDGAELKKSTSAASNKSTKSNASGKSAASEKSGKSATSEKSGKSTASQKSGKSGKSRESVTSAASEYDTLSDRSVPESDAKGGAKAKKKKSKEDVAKRSSKDSVASKKSSQGDAKPKKKSSKDSVASKKSSQGDAKPKKKSSKDSVTSQKSNKGEGKGKKGSKGSTSSGKKGSRGSK